jgi:hypothetical protein
VTEGPLRRPACIVAMDVERGQSRCGRNPCDIREFVDLVGIADDMTHRPPADTVCEVFGAQRGRGRHDDRRRAVRGFPAATDSNQSTASLNRPPMSGQRKAASAASSSRRHAVGFSAGWSVPRSGLLKSVHLGNLR